MPQLNVGDYVCCLCCCCCWPSAAHHEKQQQAEEADKEEEEESERAAFGSRFKLPQGLCSPKQALPGCLKARNRYSNRNANRKGQHSKANNNNNNSNQKQTPTKPKTNLKRTETKLNLKLKPNKTFRFFFFFFLPLTKSTQIELCGTLKYVAIVAANPLSLPRFSPPYHPPALTDFDSGNLNVQRGSCNIMKLQLHLIGNAILAQRG